MGGGGAPTPNVGASAIIRQPFPLSQPPIAGISWFQIDQTDTGNVWTLIESSPGQFVIGLQPKALATDADGLARQLFFAVEAPVTTPPPTTPQIPPPVFLVSYVIFQQFNQVYDSNTPVVGISDSFDGYVTPSQSQAADVSQVVAKQQPDVFNTFYIDFQSSSGFPPGGQPIQATSAGIFGQVLQATVGGTDPMIQWQSESYPKDVFTLLNGLPLSSQALYQNATVIFATQIGFPGRTLQIDPTGPDGGGAQFCTVTTYPCSTATDSDIESGGLPNRDVFRLEFVSEDSFFIRFTPSPVVSCFWYLFGQQVTSNTGVILATATDVNTRFNDNRFLWQAPLVSGDSVDIFDWDVYIRGEDGVVPVVTPPTRRLYNVGLDLAYNFGASQLQPVAFLSGSIDSTPRFVGAEGSYCYVFGVSYADSSVGILTEFLNRPLTLNQCCIGTDLTPTTQEMCRFTDLQPGTTTCDIYMTDVCEIQMPQSQAPGCQCFQAPPQRIPGVDAIYDQCFDPACWSDPAAYKTPQIQSVAACPRHICITALKVLLRSVFYQGTVTSDCLNVQNLPAATQPNFNQGLSNGGDTPNISNTFVHYSGILDYTIMAGLVLILLLLVCATVSMVRWKRHRELAAKEALRLPRAKHVPIAKTLPKPPPQPVV